LLFHECSFDLSREVVAVSLDLFDRYLATRGNECTGNLALLTSLTTLYIAMKLYDPKKLELDTLANLSRGQFAARDVTEMEWQVLEALGWKLHPVTATSFVSHLLLFLPAEASPSVRKELHELSKYLTELAVCDSYFVDQNNSIVAFAAILNVMEDMGYAQLSAGIRERFLRDLMEKVGLSYGDPRVVTARQRIRAMFAATSGTASPTSATMDTTSVAEFDPATEKPVHGETPPTSTDITTASMASNLSRANSSGCSSVDSSKGSAPSCRYSPSPHRPRRTVIAGASPARSRHSGLSRAHLSSSACDASVQ